jgi:hypothetical protein
LLQQVHGKFSIGSASFKRAIDEAKYGANAQFSGSGELLRQSAGFVTHHEIRCFQAFWRLSRRYIRH